MTAITKLKSEITILVQRLIYLAYFWFYLFRREVKPKVAKMAAPSTHHTSESDLQKLYGCVRKHHDYTAECKRGENIVGTTEFGAGYDFSYSYSSKSENQISYGAFLLDRKEIFYYLLIFLQIFSIWFHPNPYDTNKWNIFIIVLFKILHRLFPT